MVISSQIPDDDQKALERYCHPEHKVNLSLVEDLNNKIRVLQRRSYGAGMKIIPIAENYFGVHALRINYIIQKQLHFTGLRLFLEKWLTSVSLT